ncbi:MAG: hypothetical protein JW712_12500 [Dehalococcoidales bacterium]|nr:hypothetical protein [Dehalococcoidales bacterium]
MPKFNKGDKVKVSPDSHSPYRGQIGEIDETASGTTGLNESEYMVRFEWKGLRPAARFTEDELESVSEEMLVNESPAPQKFVKWSQTEAANQFVQVSRKKKYMIGAAAVAVVLIGTIIGVVTLGGKDNAPPAEFTSTADNVPILTESANATMKLVFTNELVEATAGSVFPVSPKVKIVDANGEIVTNPKPVTLIVKDKQAELYGTTTVDTVNGVAEFNDLVICVAGNDYNLTAISPGLPSAFSKPFDVKHGEAARLYFAISPKAAGLGSYFAFKVAVLDYYGNIVTDSDAEVTVGITPDTGHPDAVLSGVATQKALNGIASFNYVTIEPENYKYKLTATSPGLEPDTSTSFNVADIAEQNAEAAAAASQ